MKTVIELAKEAGFKLGTAWYGSSKVLERFAALVVAEREWVDLTDDEIHAAINEPTEDLEVMMWRANYCRAVIAAFKEKNK